MHCNTRPLKWMYIKILNQNLIFFLNKNRKIHKIFDPFYLHIKNFTILKNGFIRKNKFCKSNKYLYSEVKANFIYNLFSILN